MSMITVSQLNRHISELVSGDRELKGFMLRAEIAQVDTFRAANGTMLFLTLKDEQSEIKANLYSGVLSRLKFRPEKGMSVIVMGSVSVYEKRGTYSVTIMDMAADGAGLAAAALDELKKKLAKEGFFSEEHKRPLPYMPKKIGVVTSLTGAVVHDITDTLTTRYPLCEVYAVHCQVQGAGAPESIVRGIMRAESAGCDVIIVGRGGGSLEDLWAFNEEEVAYAIFQCPIPVISAVGHEIDFTISDFTADLRAATPSAAAELAVPDIRQTIEDLEDLKKSLDKGVERVLKNKLHKIAVFEAKLNALSPANKLNKQKLLADSYNGKLDLLIKKIIKEKKAELETLSERLKGVSPLERLKAGMAYVTDASGKRVVGVEGLNENDKIKLTMKDGYAFAYIEKVVKEG